MVTLKAPPERSTGVWAVYLDRGTVNKWSLPECVSNVGSWNSVLMGNSLRNSVECISELSHWLTERRLNEAFFHFPIFS